jgi:hypothetical protein
MTDKHRIIAKEQINEILALADLTWYLNILPFTICQSDMAIAKHRKQRIERILDACIKGISYYDDWTSIHS